MDVFARSTGEETEIYTVENRTGPLVVLGAALGVVSALIVVALLWAIGIPASEAVIGGIAGGVAGAATAFLGAPSRL